MRKNQIRVTILVLCSVLWGSGYAGQIVVSPPQDVGMSPERLGRIGTAVQALVADEKIAGASVLAARKGKVVFLKTFGMMDKEAGKPQEKPGLLSGGAARPESAPLLARDVEESPKAEIKRTRFRGAYYMNGEIHVNTYGTPEGKPLTTGHWDFKPSWSKTGDMLVFFRRLKNDPVVTNWKTAICIINVDGTGFHQLTDGTHTDFNQTWTRDGTNTPIWNRKHPEKVSFQVMASKVGNKPGREIALTDKSYHTWAYTCLIDGRILVQSAHPKQGHGYYLMTPNVGGEPKFERITCELAAKGLLDRVSVSPSETKVCFEYQTGFTYKDTGRTLYIADFDAKVPSITNAVPFANEERANRWFAYPRWTRDETAIVYHASPSLYLYSLQDGSTVKVSTNDNADYRYPHCEATPK